MRNRDRKALAYHEQNGLGHYANTAPHESPSEAHQARVDAWLTAWDRLPAAEQAAWHALPREAREASKQLTAPELIALLNRIAAAPQPKAPHERTAAMTWRISRLKVWTAGKYRIVEDPGNPAKPYRLESPDGYQESHAELADAKDAADLIRRLAEAREEIAVLRAQLARSQWESAPRFADAAADGEHGIPANIAPPSAAA